MSEGYPYWDHPIDTTSMLDDRCYNCDSVIESPDVDVCPNWGWDEVAMADSV